MTEIQGFDAYLRVPSFGFQSAPHLQAVLLPPPVYVLRYPKGNRIAHLDPSLASITSLHRVLTPHLEAPLCIRDKGRT